MKKEELEEKFRGFVFRLAFGDALGAPPECMDPCTFEKLDDMKGGAWVDADTVGAI